MENIKNVIEAIIFASGSPIAKKDLCEKIPELTSSAINTIIKDLQKRYSGDCGILLVEFNGKVQFTSNPKYGDCVADVLTPLREKDLTKTLLEVLATIAYKQPITRSEIDDMRGGTSSEYALSGLLKANLIEAVGRKDTVGRPVLYGTTDSFLRKFQLENIDELPDLIEVMEKIQLIYTPVQDTLFHTRTFCDENGNFVEQEEMDKVASDLDSSAFTKYAEVVDEEVEIPDFLDGEEFEVID